MMLTGGEQPYVRQGIPQFVGRRLRREPCLWSSGGIRDEEQQDEGGRIMPQSS